MLENRDPRFLRAVHKASGEPGCVAGWESLPGEGGDGVCDAGMNLSSATLTAKCRGMPGEMLLPPVPAVWEGDACWQL